MREITKPMMLDQTGRKIVDYISSVAEALWQDKAISVQPKAVNFVDYDGKVVYSYTAEEFAELEVLPPNPSHAGLRAQGWNWTLAEAQRYVAAYGACEIGQMYITDDGTTRAHIEIGESERLTLRLRFAQTVANGVTVDWGDGSEAEAVEALSANIVHTYPTAGRYTIRLTVTEGCEVRLGTATSTAVTSDTVIGADSSSAFVGTGVTEYYGTGRSALRALEIGAGVVAIGSGGLDCESHLEAVTIPRNVVTIYQNAFRGCFALRAVVVPRGVTAINQLTFRCCYKLEAVSLPEGLTTVGVGAFMTCISLVRVSVPEGVTALPRGVFQRCFSAQAIVVPNSVKSFGTDCFEACYELRTVRIPSGVTAISDRMFTCCYSLASLDLPEGIKTLGKWAFVRSFAMKEITIPASVTSIGELCFCYADGTSVMHIKATTPPTMAATSALSTAYTAIYVPWSEDHSVLAAYQAATNWNNFASILREEEEPA